MNKIKKKASLSIVFTLLITSILGIISIPVIAHTENDPFPVDLIAGGGNEESAINVGEVLVWNDADYLYVKYVIEDTDWCLTETHLHIATSPDLIPQKNGNPIPGHFDYKKEHDCLESYIYQIPLTWSMDDVVYIAAHAVVQKLIGYEPPSMTAFADALPDSVIMSVQYPYEGGPAYFPLTSITGDPLLGEYEGWCVDTDHTISQNTPYTANAYSSYEPLPEGLIEYPENLDLVNWILNQDYVGKPSSCDGDFTYGDVQRAIWGLVEDTQSTSGLGSWSPCRVDEILAAAQVNGEGFEPGCGDSIGIILEPVSGEQIIIGQITFIDVGLECTPIYQSETAWGAGFDFPGRNWATFFEYTIQGEIPVIWPESGTVSIAYEDLPLTGGNDWDYNDFVVDIDILAIFFGTSTYRDLIQINFTVRPEAKIAGYTHKMHLDTNTFNGVGTYELYRDGSLAESGEYNSATGIDVVLVPNTGALPNEVILSINFVGPCEFSFPEWDETLYHGENLFYDPYLYVYNTGQEIHKGDVRLLTVPIDWQWPTPDGNAIWNVYPKVTAGNPPEFVVNWWES